ncbi:hypothetical protein BWQ96_06034 [Gracilariopsis chorda]|uniref:Uncharacterized protein n=1 Tax=Gracilariopsis chorda TaxID=448386 RepID=A0A2V3IQ28_9FLOR|nr:hypothetical protein BWQ96_06034 [Gracilariopsis chorda]|eukprot:PXF44174.1 hypothetical protein BWQ96_06034 [Gracilariopsis chorda]
MFNGSNGLQFTTNGSASEASHARSHSQLPYGWMGEHNDHSEIPTVICSRDGMGTVRAPNPAEVNRATGDEKEENVSQAKQYSPRSAVEGPPAERLQRFQSLPNTLVPKLLTIVLFLALYRMTWTTARNQKQDMALPKVRIVMHASLELVV